MKRQKVKGNITPDDCQLGSKDMKVQCIQKPFTIPITERTTKSIDNLKFNCLMLPFLLDQRDDRRDIESQSDLQPQIIPRDLKIEEMPFKKQNIYIDVQYVSDNVLQKAKFKLQFDLDSSVQQVSYDYTGKSLVSFNDNINLMEFITLYSSRVDEFESKKNTQQCENTKKALRLISIINNNFSAYRKQIQVDQEFNKSPDECQFLISIVSEYL